MAFPLVVGAGAALIGAGIQAYGAYQNSQWEPSVSPVSPEEIRGQMSLSQGLIGQMGGTVNQMGGTVNEMRGTVGHMMSGYNEMAGIGRDLMDPNSQVNVDQQNRMSREGSSQLALSTLLNKRQAASSGLDSGILAAQGRAGQQNLSASLRDQFANQMTQNRTQGIGVLGNAQSLLGNVGQLQGTMGGIQGQMGGIQGQMGQMQLGIDENVAQAQIAGNQWLMDEEQRKQDAKTSMYSAIGGGISSMGGSLMGGYQYTD